MVFVKHVNPKIEITHGSMSKETATKHSVIRKKIYSFEFLDTISFGNENLSNKTIDIEYLHI